MAASLLCMKELVYFSHMLCHKISFSPSIHWFSFNAYDFFCISGKEGWNYYGILTVETERYQGVVYTIPNSFHAIVRTIMDKSSDFSWNDFFRTLFVPFRTWDATLLKVICRTLGGFLCHENLSAAYDFVLARKLIWYIQCKHRLTFLRRSSCFSRHGHRAVTIPSASLISQPEKL